MNWKKVVFLTGLVYVVMTAIKQYIDEKGHELREPQDNGQPDENK